MSVEIYLEDLKEEKQEAVKDAKGISEDWELNLDVIPLFEVT